MALAGQLSSSALQSSLRDGEFVGHWTLDPTRSEVRLRSKAMWVLPVKGVFHDLAGSGSVSPTGDVTGTVTVAAGSVDTKNRKRDEHLRSADFFDVANYPDISVSIESIRPSDDGVSVAGHLSVRGQTRPVSFDAKVSGTDNEVLLEGELLVDRGDFGLAWNRAGSVSMHNRITVHLVFTRP